MQPGLSLDTKPQVWTSPGQGSLSFPCSVTKAFLLLFQLFFILSPRGQGERDFTKPVEEYPLGEYNWRD